MRSERLSRSESQNSQNSQVMEQFSQNSHLESLATISTGSHIQVQVSVLTVTFSYSECYQRIQNVSQLKVIIIEAS